MNTIKQVRDFFRAQIRPGEIDFVFGAIERSVPEQDNDQRILGLRLLRDRVKRRFDTSFRSFRTDESFDLGFRSRTEG